MSTATTIVDQIEQQSLEFVMPQVLQGAVVQYFDASLAESRRVSGFVVKISKTRRTVDVYVPSRGNIVEQVRHIADPKLKLSNEQRENGAWDFSADAQDTRQQLAKLEQRINDLETKLNRPKKTSQAEY
jgi:glycine cleavage system H lipoate-binding protein